MKIFSSDEAILKQMQYNITSSENKKIPFWQQ